MIEDQAKMPTGLPAWQPERHAVVNRQPVLCLVQYGEQGQRYFHYSDGSVTREDFESGRDPRTERMVTWPVETPVLGPLTQQALQGGLYVEGKPIG
jgi:hypothetical protein